MEFWADYQYILAGRGRTKCGSLAHLVNPQADGGGFQPRGHQFRFLLGPGKSDFRGRFFPPRFSSTCSVSPFCFKVGAARREIDLYAILPDSTVSSFENLYASNKWKSNTHSNRNKRIKESWLKNYQRKLNENWWITIEILFTKYTYNENLYL